MNQVNLCGYLGKDFDLNYKNNIAYAKTSVAVTKVIKRENEEIIRTNWIPIILFGKKAEVIAKYLKKGDRFLGTGEIDTSSYVDENGVKKYSWQVIINNFQFVNDKKAVVEDKDIPEIPKKIAEQIVENNEIPF